MVCVKDWVLHSVGALSLVIRIAGGPCKALD
jgi:hypothetical protein